MERKKRISELFALLGFLVILAVFSLVQVRIDQVLDGILSTGLVTFSLGLELGAVWAWYKFAYQP